MSVGLSPQRRYLSQDRMLPKGSLKVPQTTILTQSQDQIYPKPSTSLAYLVPEEVQCVAIKHQGVEDQQLVEEARKPLTLVDRRGSK